jgi:hypothetical protein
VPTVLLRALMAQIHDLAKAKGFTESRVLHKVNARGELVIGLLIPPRTPGEAVGRGTSTRGRCRSTRGR